MRSHIFGLAVVVVCAVAFTGPALAQDPPPKPGPEHERLGDWLGTWTCEIPGEYTSAWTCDWFGGSFSLVCSGEEKDASGAATKFGLVIGYSKKDKAHTMYRYGDYGWSDYAKGWVRDNTWTWVFENERTGKGAHWRRQATCKMSPGAFTMKWEQSVEGGSWKPWASDDEFKCTKAK